MKRLLILLLTLFTFSCQSKPKILWTFKTGGYIYSSPSISNNLLLIGSVDSFLHALDLQTGKEVWKQDLGGHVLSKPLVYPDKAFVGAGKNFYCLNPKNGAVLWRVPAQDLIEYAPCGDHDSVYFGSNDGTFNRVSLDGKTLWTYSAGMGRKFWGNCELNQDFVFATSWDQNCYAFDRLTGVVKWKISSAQYNYSGPILDKNTVIFGSHTLLFTIEANSGKVLSKTKTDYMNSFIPYQGFLWTTDGGHFTKRTMDGKPVERMNFRPAPDFRPVLGNGYFILADSENSIQGISTQLKTLWKFKSKDAFWAPGMIHNGVYYTGNRDGNVYAFKIPQ